MELKHPQTDSKKVLFLSAAALTGEKERSAYIDAETGVELEVVNKESLVDWFANHYKDFGAKLEFVTNKRCVTAAGATLSRPLNPTFAYRAAAS